MFKTWGLGFRSSSGFSAVAGLGQREAFGVGGCFFRAKPSTLMCCRLSILVSIFVFYYSHSFKSSSN